MKKIASILLFILSLKGMLMAVELKHIQIQGVNIPIIYENTPNLGLFYLKLIFKGAGGIHNQKEYGLADLTSALFNEGTKKLGATKFAQALDQKGITLNVSSGFETMTFALNGLKEEQQDALLALQNLLNNPNFTQSAFDKVKQQAITALLEKENDFDYQASIGLDKILFANTPLEHPLEGTQESIKSINLREVEQFAKSYLNLESLTIIMGGDIDFYTLSSQLTQSLKSLPKGQRVDIGTFQASSTPKEELLIKDTKQSYIYFGAPLYVSNLQKELPKIRVASFVLGGSGFGSRILEEIRVKRGLAYSAIMRLSASNTLSYAQGYLQTSLKNQEQAKALVKEVVHTFIQKGITQKELDEAKQYLLGSEPLRNETINQRLNTAFSNYYQNLPLMYNQELLDSIQKLTVKEVNDYIKAHQEINNLSFFVVSAKSK